MLKKALQCMELCIKGIISVNKSPFTRGATSRTMGYLPPEFAC